MEEQQYEPRDRTEPVKKMSSRVTYWIHNVDNADTLWRINGNLIEYYNNQASHNWFLSVTRRSYFLNSEDIKQITKREARYLFPNAFKKLRYNIYSMS